MVKSYCFSSTFICWVGQTPQNRDIHNFPYHKYLGKIFITPLLPNTQRRTFAQCWILFSVTAFTWAKETELQLLSKTDFPNPWCSKGLEYDLWKGTLLIRGTWPYLASLWPCFASCFYKGKDLRISHYLPLLLDTWSTATLSTVYSPYPWCPCSVEASVLYWGPQTTSKAWYGLIKILLELPTLGPGR